MLQNPVNHIKTSISRRCYGVSDGQKRKLIIPKDDHWENSLLDRSKPSTKNARRDKDKLHIIFIEGPSGTGKSEVLSRFQKMGFSVHAKTYFDFYKVEQGLVAQYQSLPPPPPTLREDHLILDDSHSKTCSLYQSRWLSSLIEDLHTAEIEFRHSPSRYRDQITFFHRSPLSAWVYQDQHNGPLNDDTSFHQSLPESIPSPSSLHAVGNFHHHFWLLAMQHIQKRHSTSTILFHSDSIRIQQRMGKKQFFASAQDRLHYHSIFGDMDFNSQYPEIIKGYDTLLDRGWFDDQIDSTSSKQAQAQLSNIYQLNPWNCKAFNQRFS